MAQVRKQGYFQYQRFTINRTRRLGHGAYGAVYVAMCDQLPCAAKILHPTVLDPLDPGSNKIAERFIQECELMSSIRHPNIVQFIGVERDAETGCLVLLMELLDESLTTMLEESDTPLPFNVQVDISHDIALAVAYLHSIRLVHRDLSSNNVLILARQRAKVTDFGMSIVTDFAQQMTPLTMCPGTLAYMPPEALREPPIYTEKIDCFSQGVLMLQICTRKWPDPGPRTTMVPFPNSPTGTVEIPVPETERRKSHIDLLHPDHSLLILVKACLQYTPTDRPTACELCEAIEDIKTHSNQETHQTRPINYSLLQTGIDCHPNTTCTESIVDLAQEKKSWQLDKDRIAKQVQSHCKQTNTTDKVTSHLESLQVQAQQVSTEDATNRTQQEARCERVFISEPTNRMTLEWSQSIKAPVKMSRAQCCISNEDILYCKSRGNIHTYCLRERNWKTENNSASKLSPMVTVNGQPTVIGGKKILEKYSSAKILSLVRTKKLKWVEQFPPMPSPRSYSSAVCIDDYLIVLGGTVRTYYVNIMGGEVSEDQTKHGLDTVEILHLKTKTWTKAAKLPTIISCASATVCEDRLYLLGGYDSAGKTKSVLTCSIEQLINSSRPITRYDVPTDKADLQVWSRIADVPYYCSSCVVVNGQLLTIGGLETTLLSIMFRTDIYRYNKAANLWEKISELKLARSNCSAVVLPGNQLMVIGGWCDENEETDSIEVFDYHIC